ncbi:hypothetical protein EVAR_88644_1 [Eumeta japonica]|uniref:Uncharacterized protein n=1 Tax=Eumeta variegata TaxID=151549 RepID=A0A4C1X442_EUMVA|nr:hypothetical protein EVAR_88644_1 [Eumeta japonica]
MSPVWRSSKILSVVTTKQKRAALPSPIHRSPKQNYRVPIGRSAHAVDTCHSPGLPLSFMSRSSTHPHPLQLRINLCGCRCGCRNDADVPHADADANIRNIPIVDTKRCCLFADLVLVALLRIACNNSVFPRMMK